jgi:pimeloyl-ACP methyl ester carboxylesterase
MKSTRIKTQAGHIAILERGQGTPTVLLIHGNSGTKDTFEEQLHELSSRHKVVAIDLSGHGESDNAVNPDRDYTIRGYARTVAEVVNTLGLNDIVIVGTSLGGFIGLEYASWGESVVGLMIVGAPPFSKSLESIGAAFLPGPGLELSGKQDLSADDVDSFVGMHSLGSGVDPDVFRAAIERTHGLARSTMVASLLAPDASDFRHLAESCPVPMAVAVGQADVAVSETFIAAAPYRNLWRERVHIIPRSGHAPHLSNPAAFNHLVLSFADSLRVGKADAGETAAD